MLVKGATRVQLSISQHCFRLRLGTKQATTITWTNDDPVNWCIYVALRGDGLNTIHMLIPHYYLFCMRYFVTFKYVIILPGINTIMIYGHMSLQIRLARKLFPCHGKHSWWHAMWLELSGKFRSCFDQEKIFISAADRARIGCLSQSLVTWQWNWEFLKICVILCLIKYDTLRLGQNHHFSYNILKLTFMKGNCIFHSHFTETYSHRSI